MAESAQKSSSINTQLGASRPKYWSEIDDKEKIERLRAFMHDLSYQLNRIRDDIDFLMNHQHEENGNVIVKINKDNKYRLERASNNLNSLPGLSSIAKEKDEVYV